MKLAKIYKIAYMFGIKNDPRGEKEVKDFLKNEGKSYNSLSDKEKKYFDTEKLENPYADTRIIFDTKEEIKTILVGIDMEIGEILLADRLKEKGKKIDLVFAHHPEGKAYANFYDVMDMQADIFKKFGVAISAAEDMTSKRKREVAEKVMPANHYRTYDAAKLLNISIMNAHTPADNCVATYLQKKFDSEKPRTVGDIIDMLMQEPEYQEYSRRGLEPIVLVGDKKRKAGKIFVDMTGGTEGPKDIYKRLSLAGVDTVVGMHFSADHKKAIEEANLNAVIAGHISSDSLGMNILFDEIEKQAGKLKIYETSGFIRFKR